MSATVRRYPFRVRPLHRETAESYSRRVLRRNLEDDGHKAQLIRESGATTVAGKHAAWLSILSTKAGRDLAYVVSPHSDGMSHIDGTSCEFCTDQLPERWMCTLCSQGAEVRQHPHFDDLVCLNHRRWVGLTDSPASQHAIGLQHVEAARVFAKLRRTGRLDVRLYILLTSTLTAATSSDGGQFTTEEQAFPTIVQLAKTLTSTSFARQFFDTRSTFAAAYEHLRKLVHHVVGEAAVTTVRALWLYLRPAVVTLRTCIARKTEYSTSWPHDYRLSSAVATEMVRRADALEPFDRYLEVTGDTPLTVARLGPASFLTRTAEQSNGSTTTRRKELSICSRGHQFESSTVGPDYFVFPRKMPRCPVCSTRLIQPGINDLATTHPAVAREFDETMNYGLTAADISASSKTKYNWRCPYGHSHSSTASNRTSAKSKCPVCLQRVVVAGVNDVATTHPDIVATWHPSYLTLVPPSSLTHGSNRVIDWLCENEHEYSMRLWDRVNGGGCPECTRANNQKGEFNLRITHPALAAEWHPSLNGERQPEDFTHGSKESACWLCPVGHEYWTRIERRTRGYNCKVCSRRTLVPNVNDLATTEPILASEYHPYMNRRSAEETLAGTARHWWLCKAHGHKTQQAVVHRIKSRGCSECPAHERILATAS
jgi:hypothetical protein